MMVFWQLFVQVPASVLIFLTLFGALYQIFFALIFLFLCKKRHLTQKPSHFIAILIPAHNESGGLRPVLERCMALDYPKELYSVTVIADNCTDSTAQIARECGVTSLERFDDVKRGKGRALEWAIPQVLEHHPDALMILDADCYLDPKSLNACDFELSKGHHAIQIPNLVSNTDASFHSYCQSLARTMENLLFYWPKTKLGLSSFLLGTGMVLHREILERLPWNCCGLAEDFEYSIRIIANHVKPIFVGDAGLASPFPVNAEQLATQRTRWVFGGIQTLWSSFGQLLYQGVFKHNFIALDAAVSMLYISRPAVFCQVALSGLIGTMCFFLIPSLWSNLLLAIFLGAVAIYMTYVMIGVFTLGLTWRRVKLLLCIPLFVIKYFVIVTKSILVSHPTEWERTPRNREPKP